MWHCPAAPQAAHRTRASLVSSGACHPHNQPSMLPLQACAALPAGGRVSACLMSVLKKAAMPLSSREAKGAVYCTENTEAWSRGGAKVSARLRRGVCACVCVCGGGGGTAGTRQAPPAAPRLQPILTHQPSDAVRAATQTDARPPMGSLPASQPWMSWLAGTPAAPPPASCQLPAARCCGSCGAAERGPPPTWISALLRTIWYSWSTCLCRWGSSVSSGLRGDSKAASGEGQGVGYARAAGKDRSRRGVGGRPQGRGWDREGSGPQNRRPPQLAPHALFACHRHQPDCPASPATASITPSACPTFPLQHDPEHPSACQHSPSAHLSLSRWRRHDA
jgi:hypothetical protein